jgi:hypothetical protein
MNKELKTVDEIVNDLDFKNYVETELQELIKKRINRPEPKEGYRYKRDWYDRMNSEGILNADFFIKNIKSVWERKSSFSSEFRNIIQYVCETALQKTLSFDNPELLQTVS